MEILSFNHYGGFFRRLIAFFIDRFLLWLLFLFVIIHLTGTEFEMWNFRHLFNRESLLAEHFIIIYFVFCEASSWQGTIGKRIMGLKVVNRSFQKIEVKDALLRFLSKYLSMAVLFLGFIWIIFDERKQGWHDKIAGTFVVTRES